MIVHLELTVVAGEAPSHGPFHFWDAPPVLALGKMFLLLPDWPGCRISERQCCCQQHRRCGSFLSWEGDWASSPLWPLPFPLSSEDLIIHELVALLQEVDGELGKQVSTTESSPGSLGPGLSLLHLCVSG